MSDLILGEGVLPLHHITDMMQREHITHVWASPSPTRDLEQQQQYLKMFGRVTVFEVFQDFQAM